MKSAGIGIDVAGIPRGGEYELWEIPRGRNLLTREPRSGAGVTIVSKLSRPVIIIQVKLPISVFKRYHSDVHFSEFYPQDGGENQLAWLTNKITSLTP